MSPPPGSTLVNSTVLFQWSAPVSSGYTEFWLDVGTHEAQGDLFAAQLTTREKLVANLPLDGKPIYVRLWTFVNGSRQMPRDYKYETRPDPSYVDPRAKITSPAPGSRLEPSVTFTWTPAPKVTHYWLDVGNHVGQGDIYAGNQGLATSRTVSNLPADGRILYVRLWTMINDTRLPPVDYTYRAARTKPPGSQ